MESKEQYFGRMSRSRSTRRQMAKELGFMKYGWQNIKEDFPPFNQPMNLGINKFKKTGANPKDVLEYKLEAYGAFSQQ